MPKFNQEKRGQTAVRKRNSAKLVYLKITFAIRKICEGLDSEPSFCHHTGSKSKLKQDERWVQMMKIISVRVFYTKTSVTG